MSSLAVSADRAILSGAVVSASFSLASHRHLPAASHLLTLYFKMSAPIKRASLKLGMIPADGIGQSLRCSLV